ncbi:MAG: hypothetical protein E7390_00070 [Ruminococcaceae bacterium]|nr:hypothetical protein [Oscillospiraceae bacterium]
MKKLIFTLMLCLLLSPIWRAEAAYSGTVKYGGFEESKAVGVEPQGWSCYSNSPWYGNFKTDAEYVAQGSLGLKTVTSQSTGIPQALISGAMYWGYFDTDATYELSIKILVPEGSSVNDALLRAVIRDAEGNTSNLYTPGAQRISGDTDGEWKTIRLPFTPKVNFAALETVYIRCNGGQTGTAYWDDLQLHKLNEDGTYADMQAEETFPAESDILINGDFSNVSGAKPTSWYASGAWGTIAVLSPNADGTKAGVKLCGSGAPYIYQTFGVQGGETYTIKGRFMTNGGNPVLKFAYTGASEFTTEALGNTHGKWRDFRYDFKVPDGVQELSLYFRKYGETEVSYADLHVYKTEEAPLITLKTDNETTFYYATWQTGQVTFHLNGTPENGETVRFYLWDGEKQTGVQTSTAGEGTFTFSLADLAKGKPYEVRCERIKGSTVLDMAKKTIYCFDPPGAVNENGQMQNADGTFSDVVFGYHVYEADMTAAAAAGVNAIQGMGDFETGSMKTFLDAAQTAGLRVLVPLYGGNMLPAGHYVNRERTEAIIKEYKDHPAVLGWMIQDEPFLQMRNEPENVRQLLLDSYLLIRSIDPYHPTYMTADHYSAEHYVDIGNACDIIAPDQYPIGSGQAVTDVYANMAEVNEAVRGRKPVYALLQTFAYAGSRQPTIDELMHMIYQSFFAGADAIGFYSFREGNGSSSWKLEDTQLYSDILAAKNELCEAYRLFRRTDATEEIHVGGLMYRVFPDETCILLNNGTEAVCFQRENIKIAYGNGTLEKDGENVYISLEALSRAIGKAGTIPFKMVEFRDAEGNLLSTLLPGTVRIQIAIGEGAIVPEGACVVALRSVETNGILENTDVKMCKAVTGGTWETTLEAKGIPGEKIEVLLYAPGGQPIYEKAVMQ